MDFENKAKEEIEVELRGLRGSYLSDYKEKKQREAMAEEERIQRELGEARLREKERLESFLLAEEQKKKEREALLERMKARLLGGDEPLIPKEVEAGKSYSELPSEINAPAEESLAEALSAEASEAAAVLCDEENEDNITAESLEDNSSEADAQMAALSFEEAPAVSDIEDEKISSDEAPIEEAHFDEEQPSAEEPRSEVREVDGRIILTVREVNAARANEPHRRFCIRIDGAEAPRVKVENENENLGQTAPRAEFSLPHEETETARYDRRGDGLHDIDAELDAIRSSIEIWQRTPYLAAISLTPFIIGLGPQV